MISDAHLEWLSKQLLKAVEERFTGNIQINFYQGGITNINKQESIKPPVLSK